MSILTITKKNSTASTNIEDEGSLLTAVTTTNMLNQLRDSEYDEDDDLLTSRPTPTGSPPPGTVTSPNSAGTILIF